MVYFIISTEIDDNKDRALYNEYIEKVKPIVESFGGRYITRSENIKALSNSWKPDRIIVVEFESETQIESWLSSLEYKAIESLRVNSVKSSAIIVKE